MMGAHPDSPSYDEWYEKLKEARIGEQRLGTATGSHMFGKPSTGVSLIYLLKDLCRSLDVYGFGTHDAAGNPGDYKYYNVMKTSIGQVCDRREKSRMHWVYQKMAAKVLWNALIALSRSHTGSRTGRGRGWSLTWVRAGSDARADQLRQEWQPRALVRSGDGARAGDGQGRAVQVLPVPAGRRRQQPALLQRACRHGPRRSHRL